MKPCVWKRVVILSAVLLPLGCNDTGTTGTTHTTQRTTTTTTRQTDTPPATMRTERVDTTPGRNANGPAGQTADSGRGAVDVDVTPGGGVDVDVRGEPIRDRIRERRAARDAPVPR